MKAEKCDHDISHVIVPLLMNEVAASLDELMLGEVGIMFEIHVSLACCCMFSTLYFLHLTKFLNCDDNIILLYKLYKRTLIKIELSGFFMIV